MLIFALFIGLLWITTGRVGYLVFGFVLFVAGAIFAAHLFQPGAREGRAVARTRGRPGQSAPLQLGAGLVRLGRRGARGNRPRHGPLAGQIPEITSDLIFAGIGIELGTDRRRAVVFAFMLLVGAGMRIAQTARSDFSRLMATGLTIIIGFQAFFIMAGVVRLLPFTGITLPFVAYGGSSLLANYILIALLMRISDEGAQKSRRISPRASSSQASTRWCPSEDQLGCGTTSPTLSSSRSSTRIGAGTGMRRASTSPSEGRHPTRSRPPGRHQVELGQVGSPGPGRRGARRSRRCATRCSTCRTARGSWAGASPCCAAPVPAPSPR